MKGTIDKTERNYREKRNKRQVTMERSRMIQVDDKAVPHLRLRAEAWSVPSLPDEWQAGVMMSDTLTRSGHSDGNYAVLSLAS